jgi:methylated-DNA-protein-cysteine methyltransferase-like protein
MVQPNAPSFFERVYEVVRMVPPGQVSTYGQIAAIISHRGAARTVGWALHGLPEDSGVPWQRVINAQGRISLGGRGSAASTQRALLEQEGVVFDARDKVDLGRYQWPGLDWPEVEALRTRWAQGKP